MFILLVFLDKWKRTKTEKNMAAGCKEKKTFQIFDANVAEQLCNWARAAAERQAANVAS